MEKQQTSHALVKSKNSDILYRAATQGSGSFYYMNVGIIVVAI